MCNAAKRPSSLLEERLPFPVLQLVIVCLDSDAPARDVGDDQGNDLSARRPLRNNLDSVSAGKRVIEVDLQLRPEHRLACVQSLRN